jgi:signal transduction histidine kinase
MRFRGRVVGIQPWLAGTVAVVVVGMGALLPTIESLLLFQAPWFMACMLWSAWLLRRTPGSVADVGLRVVVPVLVTWSVLWLLYAIAVLAVGVARPGENLPWNYLLRVNSLLDLGLQVVLAASLIVMAMHGANRALRQALHERDQLHEQLQRDERLRAMPTLVSGVAHEINNPLTAILGYADDLDAADPATRRAAATIVLEQAERCRGIVRRLSLLGRHGHFTPGAIDVGDLVQRVARGFAPQLQAAKVDLRCEVPADLPRLVGDSVGLEQVLTNLVANALQASPAGAGICVRCVDTRHRLQLEVLDAGPGVAPADRARIFEPFWTAKAAGEGTGLGLAVVDAIVRAHGGTVEVCDAAGGGAKFTVHLPWGDPTSLPTPAAPLPASPAAAAPGRGLRLLVVDDEPLVRAAIARPARLAGWQVEETDSAATALDWLLREARPFDAVVCDLRMPGMSGIEFHDTLAKSAPRWLERTVFVTGDLGSVAASDFQRRCRSPVLLKPFVAAELLDHVRQLVASA